MASSIRVLVVDDAVDYAEMVVQFLRASGEWAGASMDIAATYDHAVLALTTEPYDIAFVDYLLGARDGLALLGEIRERGIDTPIIILTAYGAEDVAVRAMKSGAADYLPKTQVSVEALDRAIRHALALRTEERQRRQAERAVRESEERFRALVENSSDALLLIDGLGRVQYMAPSSTTRRLGWTAEQLSGRSMFDFLHPDDRAQAAGALSTMLGEAGRSVTVELRAQHADGRYRTLEAIAVNHIDTPAVGAIVVNARDITARQRLEDQLRYAQKMEALGQLARGVSHDFTNLLTAILGYCDLALSDAPEGDPVRHDLEEIRSAGERAAGLTRQLLAFASRQVLHPQIVDVNVLITQLDRLLQRLLSPNVELVLKLDPDVSRIKVDPASLEQILVNLAVYARDAMPLGGSVTIETANILADAVDASGHDPMPAGSYVLVAVRDTSEGIDDDALTRIFEPFAAPEGEGSGSGFGLAAVHATVKQSGGYISVESEAGAGTAFKVFLPPAEAAVMQSTTEGDDKADQRAGWETVLVVEQDEAVRALAREVLRRHGYAVLEARHGVDALRTAERHRDAIHLLITDVVTPHMSGREVAERLTSARPNMKVLFVSGHAAEEQVVDAARGATFLRKPFTPDALALKVRALLDR
jgi:two-component system, cell cycle sensor histidine kinase and response regulator CckA